ncbi:N-6 DNA methylase [Methylovulum psychrotolerans]|nr:N-6 DNA methylase [Methylovulum psychrotolerans]
MTESLEKEYLEIVGRYSKEEVNLFCELLANFIELSEPEPADILGSLYMELELGNLNNGQFFTPHEISLLMAKLTYGNMLKNLDKPFITLSEPACGAGGMVLAFVNEMLKNNLNPAYKLFVQCIDIDRLAGFMCYLQLSLWHIPAEVIIGNTLTLNFREVYYTPAYHLMGWDNRLRARKLNDVISSLIGASDEPKTEKPTDGMAQPEIVEQKPEINPSETVVIGSNVLPVIATPKTKTQNKQKGDSTLGFQSTIFDLIVDHEK